MPVLFFSLFFLKINKSVRETEGTSQLAGGQNPSVTSDNEATGTELDEEDSLDARKIKQGQSKRQTEGKRNKERASPEKKEKKK